MRQQRAGFLLFACTAFLVMALGCVSYKPHTGKKSLVKAYHHSPLFQSHFSGFMIKDMESGDILLDVNGKKLFTPASNVKLITYYTANRLLPDSVPSMKYCTWNNTLYFSGMADPTLLHPDFKNQPVLNLLKNAPGQLAYVPRPFADERYGPGWAWDDFPYYFQPEKSIMPVYGNSLWIKKEGWDSLAIFPDYFEVDITVDTTFIKLKTSRQELENIFSIAYWLLPEKVNRSVPFRVSDSVVLDLLEDTLKRDIVIKDFPLFCDSKILYSQPKDSVFKKLLVESDNFIAEQLLLSGSALISDTVSTDKAINYAFENYFPNWKDRIEWKDGSGLSRYNMVSPDFFISLLEKIYRENDWQTITEVLPEGGKEGTLKNFLKYDPPFVYAKSGSMTSVYNLSGFLLTDKGNVLAFSLMNNNFNIPFKEVKAEVEKLLVLVKENW